MIQTLYAFEELCQHLNEVEELCVAKRKAKGIPCRKWPNFKVGTKMKLKGLQVNNNEYIGNVLSIYACGWFWYKIEMFIIGLHKQLEASIVFISKTKLPFGISSATSIVIKQFGNL